jgi:hypothetical protein
MTSATPVTKRSAWIRKVALPVSTVQRLPGDGGWTS